MKKFVIFVMTAGMLSFTGTLWAQDSWQEVTPANAPPPRTGHTMAEINGAVYLFGGKDTGGALQNDLWKFANDAWTEEIPDGAANSPAQRHVHSTAVSSGKMYIFSGSDGTQLLSDVWSYDPTQKLWNQEASSPALNPGIRSLHNTATLPDNRILLYGGLTEGGEVTDAFAWIYDPVTGN